MSARLADRAATFLAGRLDRRGFLARSAMVGSAVVAAPVDYALRPSTAYAAVCKCRGLNCACGSLCCDGYTEFCCTLTGQNACPAGTVTGGWWKVDGSEFCGGANRYYLDCNAQCGGCGCSGGLCGGSCSGTPCGCAKGDCNNRKSGCTIFRYGQCHQDIRCLGPIVCRIVTCTPPWLLDPACGTASRTDNATRSHDRPCLDLPFGAIDAVADVGGAIRVRGWAIDQADQVQTEVRILLDTASAAVVRADLPRPDLVASFPSFGGDHGFEATIPAAPGRHLVCVYIRDPANGQGQFIGVTVATVQGPFGVIDTVTAPGGNGLTLAGWIVDPALPTVPVGYQVRVDGAVVITSRVADADRPDVAASVPGAGPTHGFEVVVPTSGGAHQVCIDAITANGVFPIACRDGVAS